MAAVEIRTLGEFSISFHGQRLGSLGTPKIQSFVAYLAVHSHTPISRSQLAFLLWPDSNESQAHTNLRKCIHKIKQILPENIELFHTDNNFIQLYASHIYIDLCELQLSLSQAEKARRENLLEAEQSALENVVTHYHGDLLPSCYEEWVLTEREALRVQFIHSLERLVALLENRFYYRDAIRYAEQLLKCDPLHEATYQQLICLYALIGDRATALHVYHTCVSTLQRELSVEPAAETREVYERLLHVEQARPGPKIIMLPNKTKLVGRENEWKQLQSAWRICLTGESRLILLSGEAGIGKTRLAEEFMEWAERQGILTARATCYEAEGNLAYGPVANWLRAHSLPALEATWLREIARVVPEVLEQIPNLKPPGPMIESWQRQYLFKALRKAFIERGCPWILLLDNLQWCDRDTVEWLHYLLRDYPQPSPVMILATLRDDEPVEYGPVGILLSSLADQDKLIGIEIPRLNPDQTTMLIQNMNGGSVSTEASSAIYHETEGVPLFIIEIMRAERSSKNTSGGGARSFLPKILTIISQRLDRLTAPAREAAESASVIGRAFSFELLRQTSQLDESLLVQALDELWRRRIINEAGAMYDFTHDKIREAVYGNISTVRRRWLHQLVAEALEKNGQQNLSELSAQIAGHFQQAGLIRRAAAHYLSAARFAHKRFAIQDALCHIERAIALNQNGAEATDYFEEQGDLLILIQSRTSAAQAYQNALSCAPADGWLRRADLHQKYAAIFYRVDPERAEQALTAAERMLAQVLEKTPDYWREWLGFYMQKIQLRYWNWEIKDITPWLDLIADQIERYGTAEQIIMYLHCVIMGDNMRHRFRGGKKTVQTAQKLLNLAISLGNINDIGHAQHTLGFVLFLNDGLVEANAHFQEAIDTAQQTSDRNLLLMSLCHFSLNLRRQGQIECVHQKNDALAAALYRASISDYEGVVRANCAWLAYRTGQFEEASSQAQEAIGIWSKNDSPYVQQWTALMVLFALATKAGNQGEAKRIIEKLLARPQILLVPEVDSRLHAALEGIQQNLGPSASLCQQAVEAAERAGYL